MERYTTAGRLLAEVNKVKLQLDQTPNNPWSAIAPLVWGGEDFHWSKGLSAFVRLLGQARAELTFTSERMRERWGEAITSAASLSDPRQFAVPASALNGQVLTQLTVERLEAMDEALAQAGRTYTVEETRMAEVLADLDDFIASVEAGPSTDLDDVLLERLRELRFVLNRFALFGREGAQAAVAGMLGSVAMAGMAPALVIPDALKERLSRAGRLGKAVLDLAVYGHEGSLAIQWLGHMAGLLPPPAG